MEGSTGNSQLADAIDLTRMLEQVLASGSPGPAVMAGIRVTLRNMRDLMIEAMVMNDRASMAELSAAPPSSIEPSAPPMKLSEQMSISTSTNQPVAAQVVELDAPEPAGQTMAEDDQIAIKRGALRASIERIVDRMG
jgi:hypothetical protein